ncbi:hypothetical protein [Comamonas terrae]|uniref:Uncharacterized protein n=1 Tax=Comamonas terrae TaxID=673548 RepID=A0ABW5UIV3_9BURK|nr:hypothetical protein [Comamonas terrae]
MIVYKKSMQVRRSCRCSKSPADCHEGVGGETRGQELPNAIAAVCQAGQPILSGKWRQMGASHANVLRLISDKQNDAASMCPGSAWLDSHLRAELAWPPVLRKAALLFHLLILKLSISTDKIRGT